VLAFRPSRDKVKELQRGLPETARSTKVILVLPLCYLTGILGCGIYATFVLAIHESGIDAFAHKQVLLRTSDGTKGFLYVVSPHCLYYAS
jgi:hypothetical protein